MNIIVFTNGSLHGMEILQQLKSSGIEIECIIKEEKKLRKKELAVLSAKLGPAAFLVDLIPFKQRLYKWFRGIKYNDLSVSDLRAYADQVYEISSFNNKQCEEILRNHDVDLIVLAGSRIIKENILTIPKVGTLNAHPGLLPNYRGLDVIAWALYNEDPVGVTVHFVDAGIDSGAICHMAEIAIAPGMSLEDVKEQGRKQAGLLMAKVVNELVKTGEIQTQTNEVSKGNYYTSMPDDKMAALKNKLNSHAK